MAYASHVFDGSAEYLSRVMSTTSPTVTAYTVHLWALRTASQPMGLWAATNTTTIHEFFGLDDSGGWFGGLDNNGAEVGESATSGSTAAVWQPWTWVWDTANGTAANRIRVYRGMTLLTPGDAANPGASLASQAWANGRTHMLGAFVDPDPTPGKLAFITVIYGAAVGPETFLWDNGGTITARHTITQAYGTYGYRLDGDGGVGVDASGNGLDFTGNAMDGSNLDTGDLPPHGDPSVPSGTRAVFASPVFGRTFRRL